MTARVGRTPGESFVPPPSRLREAGRAGNQAAGGPALDGTPLKIETQEGTSAVCRAYRVSEDRLALDFNQPLAGHALTLFARVTDVVKSA